MKKTPKIDNSGKLEEQSLNKGSCESKLEKYSIPILYI